MGDLFLAFVNQNKMAMETFGFRGYHIDKLKRFGSHLLEIYSLHEESFVISSTNFPSKCKMRKKQLAILLVNTRGIFSLEKYQYYS